MSKRGEFSVELKHNGHNCAQAIACTYADCVGADKDMLYSIGQGFGGGLGGMEGHCGCLSGAAMILSLKNDNKAKTASEIRNLTKAFKDRNSTVVCKTLKGIDGGKALRSCDDYVRDVCEFVEQFLDIK